VWHPNSAPVIADSRPASVPSVPVPLSSERNRCQPDCARYREFGESARFRRLLQQLYA
jgi:hypothetical protein